MGNRSGAEGGSDEFRVSTTWEWRRVKMSRPPEADMTATTKSSRWRRFPKRNPRDPINVVLKLRGGPECWVEVRARGEVNRYPGVTSIYDVLRDINQV